MALLTLEGTACRLEYLNEGGANFVFRILSHSSEELPLRLRKKLLRLRKEFVDRPDVLLAGEDTWQAIFPAENLIQHDLIALPPTIEVINDLLHDVKDRPAHRKDDFCEGGTHGILVTDMSPGQNDRLVELKPKWLAQSPNAPLGSRRCRTCALRAQREAEKGIVTATDRQRSCPLDLVSEDVASRKLAADRLTDDERVQEYLITAALPLLRTMQRYQQTWDPKGVLAPDGSPNAHDLSKAMTLRDCTLFVLVESDGGVEARLGDLDMKGIDKVGRWRTTEQGLVDGGWYMGVDDICSLSRG
ncbi:Inositol-pentakisphosphate 2-kinase [Elasticomyces elasticus]|nr:Inositol-pentakisphosphate 2-kinase [Elasticomyces elasticus]KAK4968318.1 Inositol-pentakisphosphate 2-kinase [Elasticomyces elasticus]